MVQVVHRKIDMLHLKEDGMLDKIWDPAVKLPHDLRPTAPHTHTHTSNTHLTQPILIFIFCVKVTKVRRYEGVPSSTFEGEGTKQGVLHFIRG